MRTNKLVLTSLFIACGLLLPIAFHSFGMGGRTFLPMHLPVFMGGMLLGWLPGLIIGSLTPVLSCFLTGMPPLIPSLPMMFVELALFGLVSGYLYHDKRKNIYFALLSAMVIGRLGAAFVLMLFSDILGIKLHPLTYVAATFMTGLAGVVFQIVFIPILVKRLENIFGYEVHR
ncbi:MAG: ECF transporter S component [Phascolarctobacterium sp.]|nr:ECF transporter S component [Phascolarctobacterium sp.]MBR5486900.1 ECF transporter S component [Phascolarctobacterium sp.]MBR6510801.1 ECF transporter S component [Phascolarctobacterium sp.]